MAEQLKDRYNEEYVNRLADKVAAVADSFERERFVSEVLANGWEEFELKQRMGRITEVLRQEIEGPFAEAVEVINQVAPNFGGFEAMYFPQFVEWYGLEEWDSSMAALSWLTRFSSSEFAVRPFIEKEPELMMAQMLEWARSDNEHVRRLASEGCRPRLPWAPALPMFKQQPAPIFPILDSLRGDPSEYVRRSVANNLNDIAKDHPDAVLEWCDRYLGESKQTDRLIKHACRTLLKQAHPQALKLFGYRDPEGISGELKLTADTLSIGDTLQFRCRVSADSPLQKVRLEYGIDYLKANGRSQRKVFKLTEGDYGDSSYQIDSKQHFGQMSTRRHYPGLHRIVLLVNGEERAGKSFHLLPATDQG